MRGPPFAGCVWAALEIAPFRSSLDWLLLHALLLLPLKDEWNETLMEP
jgi:hypothetical protein